MITYKQAALIGKADIKIHPEDELGNIVTLLKGIRGKWNGHNYRVPKGFESDGVSTPRLLWPIISPPVHPHTIRGGIIHDWLYRHQPKGWTREDADRMFADVIEEDGLSPIQSELAYTGLRLFGDKAWKENAERLEAEREARKAERLKQKLKHKTIKPLQLKAASEVPMNSTYKEALMLKKADFWNPVTWFESEDEKRRREAAKVLADHKARMEEIDPGYNARQQALRDRDTAIANAVNARIDARLAGKPVPNTNVMLGTTAAGNRDAELMNAAFAAQEAAPDTVPTNRQLAAMNQRGSQKANTAIARATGKPAAGATTQTATASTAKKPAQKTRTAPPPTAQKPAQTKPPVTGRQASQQLIAGNRTPEARKADNSYTAAIRKRDSLGGKR